ncbi:MAG: class I SAM-dependent methyltransferase [Bacteroidota bacterium]
MRLLKLIILIVKAIFSDLRSLANALYHYCEEANWKQYVTVKMGFAQGLPTIDLLDLLPGLNENIVDYTYLDGTSRVTDIVVLKSLARRFAGCSYLEIGSFRGESLVNVAAVAKECVSVSLSDNEMKELGLGEHVKLQRFFSGGLQNVLHVQHNSLTYDFSQLNRKFDLIFIDGDHSYAAVKKDTENAFKLLRDENSIIVWHDYGRSYNLENWNTIAGMIDGASAENRKKIYHISNTICSVFTNREYATTFPKPLDLPNKTFKINLSAEKI